jgi:hypothetical protein
MTPNARSHKNIRKLQLIRAGVSNLSLFYECKSEQARRAGAEEPLRHPYTARAFASLAPEKAEPSS